MTDRHAADNAASAHADDPEVGPRRAQAAQEAHQRHALALTAHRLPRRAQGLRERPAALNPS